MIKKKERRRRKKIGITRWRRMISPNRWCILFLFFYQRLNRVCLLRFSSQKVRWARRWKNVPIFLKRNWIHKSVEGRRRTRVHHRCCAPCFSSSFAFPNLKVVSHVERKKARVPSDIFYRIPSPCPLSISLSRLIYSTRYTPLPSAFPQLKTFDFPRRNLSSKKIIRANVSVFFPFRWLTIREFSC